MENQTSKPDGTDANALIPSERSLEVRVGDKAVAQLRTDLGITHPDLESLFFSPQDFSVIYGVIGKLDEIKSSVTEELFAPVFIKRVLQYVDEHAVVRARKGIFAKIFGKNKRLYVDLYDLYNSAADAMRKQVYEEVFSGQLAAVDAVQSAFFDSPHDCRFVPSPAQKIEEKLDKLIEETNSFVRNFSIVPVNESTAQRVWEAIIPVMQKTSLLFGLYSEEKAVPFNASGTESSQSRTENIMPQHTLLGQQYGMVLSDKLLMLVEDFNKDLGEIVKRLSMFAKKDAKMLQNLQMSIALYNYFMAGLYNEGGKQLSGAYTICINRALREIKTNLTDSFKVIGEFKLPYTNVYLSDILERQGFEMHYGSGAHYSAVKPLS